MRVIADHARCATFLIADGVFPKERAQLRAPPDLPPRGAPRHSARHRKPFMHEVCMRVVAEMGEQYPDLVTTKTTIARGGARRGKRFRATLQRGLALLEDEFTRMAKTGENSLRQGRVHPVRHVRLPG